ncbi:MAG: hypothetical protein FRX49_04218, partial [Trebouxia sp. A1-2]
LHTKLSQAPGVATQSSPGRHFLGASRDSNKPAPAGDIRSAARIDSLKRIAGFVVGAGVFLSFEPVPVVGGPQLVFGIFKPVRQPRQPSKAAAGDSPKAVSRRGSAKEPAAGVAKAAATGSNRVAPDVSTKPDRGGSPSEPAALLDSFANLKAQLMEVTDQAYSVAHSGLLKTYHNDRAFWRRLSDKVYGNGFNVSSKMSLQPQHMINTGSRKGDFPCAFGIGQPAADMQVGLAAGAMLHTQTSEELVNIIACEMGHSIAYHEAERKSWRLLLNTVIIGSLAASSSVGLLPLAAAAVGIDAVVNKVIVGIWLHCRQQYEADRMGAVISLQAGCSADSIISYMQRAHLSEVLDRVGHFSFTDATFSQSVAARSASLRQLVPKSDLPEKPPLNLQELQAWICISASEAKALSPEAKTKFDAEVKTIEHMLVGISHSVWDPVQRWVDPYPGWLDRIACLHTLLKPVQPLQKRKSPLMDTLQTSLTSLQASEHWPQAVKFMGVKDLVAKAKYDHRLNIRRLSDVHLTSEINKFEMVFAKHGWIS